MKESLPKVLSGKPAAKGIGIGNAWLLKEADTSVRPEKIEDGDIQVQLKKFYDARDYLTAEYEKIKQIPDDYDLAEIIEAQIQTLHDPEVESSVNKKIGEKLFTAEYAVFSTFNEYIQLLEATGSTWANDRTIDVLSIRDELIEATRDKRRDFDVEKGEIVFAKDISPTNMVKLSRIKIGGIVMQKGGLTSHAVILSQSLGIPCVINANWERFGLKNGSPVIIDGSTGQVILWPSWKQEVEYRKRQADELDRYVKALEWATKPDKTKCGAGFTLRANVEFLEELPRIESHGARGIGLLRTETLLFQTEEFDVNDQVEFYSKMVEAVDGDTVTIRLFDAGGDKMLENSENEANPFLGWRGVRMLLDKKNLLIKQLEAIYRVSGIYPGKVKILIPMVSRIEEIKEVKQLCGEVIKSLQKKQVACDQDLEIGVMVEVPSIALMAERAAKHADFFSIGTNDLTQYTIAVDRGNEKISYLFDSFHPSVWKLINMTLEGALKVGIPVSVCGEMASKPEAAACLLGMGITDLSMNTGSIPGVKAVLCNHTLADMKQLAKQVLETEELKKVHQLLDPWRSA